MLGTCSSDNSKSERFLVQTFWCTRLRHEISCNYNVVVLVVVAAVVVVVVVVVVVLLLLLVISGGGGCL